MDKTIIVTKIRRWQVELREMIESFHTEKKGGAIIDILKKREDELEQLIGAVQDESFISSGDVSFEPHQVIDEIAVKVKKIKEGVKKLGELKLEKKKILKEMSEE